MPLRLRKEYCVRDDGDLRALGVERKKVFAAVKKRADGVDKDVQARSIGKARDDTHLQAMLNI